jgi:cytochrome c-type biogenesis protein CcmH
MIVFWLIGALLAAAALALVLRPRRRRGVVSRSGANVSIYRDQLRELEADRAAGTLAQADYERARRELEARLLEDVDAPAEPERRGGKGLVASLIVALPICALLVYFLVGNPSAIDPETHGVTVRQVEAMVERLATRLKDNPDDVEGWKMLGRSYSVLGRFPQAADAYAKAAARAPRDAQLLVDLADALAMARGERLEGEPEKLVARALEIDPKNLKGLALAGTAAFNRKDYAIAARLWERMLPLVPADSEDARMIQANVNEARALSQQSILRGTVRLAPALKAKVAPEDTVFIFARAADGSPMPLAVLKKQARELPLSFALDDSMAMTPGSRLSLFPRVVVGARISKSGNAKPQPGDLQGASAPVANDSNGVTVVIDTVVR